MNHPDELLPTRLDRTIIYESPWVNLYRDKVALPSGRVIEQYHILDFGSGGVAVLVENQDRQILIERVARYPTGTVTWELPAGRIEAGETVLEAAEREVREETGYETQEHCQVYAYHLMDGWSNMTVHLVYCRVGERTGKGDGDEVQAIDWFSLEDLRQMIRRHEITDGFALVGILLHLIQV
jgi:ADP-ribose pyrophosphatase